MLAVVQLVAVLGVLHAGLLLLEFGNAPADVVEALLLLTPEAAMVRPWRIARRRWLVAVLGRRSRRRSGWLLVGLLGGLLIGLLIILGQH
jgi:hypothetical protein